MPADVWLTEAQNELKWGVVEAIERLGYVPEIFFDPTGRTSLASNQAWSADAADEVMEHCSGAALIGLPRWVFEADGQTMHVPTEYCHYEGALARAAGLPLLVIAQTNLVRRAVFDDSFGPYIGRFAEDADRSWLQSRNFTVPFGYWTDEMRLRRDVFLGYCSAASDLALELRNFLEHALDATVLDWQRDFAPGRSILEEIEEARSRCTAGVFLFTKDDAIASPGGAAAPRDNVVFEAGYFAAAKGKQRVLVVREADAKMPADLGGDIYASLTSRADLTEVTSALTRFLATL